MHSTESGVTTDMRHHGVLDIPQRNLVLSSNAELYSVSSSDEKIILRTTNYGMERAVRLVTMARDR